jgi:hypothetical protein
MPTRGGHGPRGSSAPIKVPAADYHLAGCPAGEHWRHRPELGLRVGAEPERLVAAGRPARAVRVRRLEPEATGWHRHPAACPVLERPAAPGLLPAAEAAQSPFAASAPAGSPPGCWPRESRARTGNTGRRRACIDPTAESCPRIPPGSRPRARFRPLPAPTIAPPAAEWILAAIPCEATPSLPPSLASAAGPRIHPILSARNNRRGGVLSWSRPAEPGRTRQWGPIAGTPAVEGTSFLWHLIGVAARSSGLVLD